LSGKKKQLWKPRIRCNYCKWESINPCEYYVIFIDIPYYSMLFPAHVTWIVQHFPARCRFQQQFVLNPKRITWRDFFCLVHAWPVTTWGAVQALIL
jgi:hypothetical protein